MKSTNENELAEEALSDREKARYRQNRRPSVQFIDKNLIRRRSMGQDKPFQQPTFQQSQLPSITAEEEYELNEVDTNQPPSTERSFSIVFFRKNKMIEIEIKTRIDF